MYLFSSDKCHLCKQLDLPKLFQNNGRLQQRVSSGLDKPRNVLESADNNSTIIIIIIFIIIIIIINIIFISNNLKGFIDIKFTVRVQWETFTPPIARVKRQKNKTWRVFFREDANFSNGMMWDANLRNVYRKNVDYNSIVDTVFSCECLN